jgi:hypothetical protein
LFAVEVEARRVSAAGKPQSIIAKLRRFSAQAKFLMAGPDHILITIIVIEEVLAFQFRLWSSEQRDRPAAAVGLPKARPQSRGLRTTLTQIRPDGAENVWRNRKLLFRIGCRDRHGYAG